jgi:hypothetical protein
MKLKKTRTNADGLRTRPLGYPEICGRLGHSCKSGLYQQTRVEMEHAPTYMVMVSPALIPAVPVTSDDGGVSLDGKWTRELEG